MGAPPEGEAAIRYTQSRARAHRIPRCADCWLHIDHCVCAELPRLSIATRVVLVAHHVEMRRSSNTGRLAALVLGADVRLRGLPGGTNTGSDEPLPERRLVLFPAERSRILTRQDGLSGPLTLIVPDGSWKQARGAAQRDRMAIGAEFVALPPGGAGRYQLRRQTRESTLCTFEAIARAIGILEGPEIETAMMAALDLFVERTLKLRTGGAS